MSGALEHTVGALKQALAAVEEAGVPEDLRVSAFEATYSSLLGGAHSPPAPAAQGPPPATSPPSEASGAESGKLAGKLKIDATLIERVFDFDEDGVHLLVGTSDLSQTRAEAQRQVAFLLTAARQGAGLEDWTSVEEVRAVATDLGLYDRAFATRIASLKGARMRMRGDARTRELKINQPGYEDAAAIVRSIVEGGEK